MTFWVKKRPPFHCWDSPPGLSLLSLWATKATVCQSVKQTRNRNLGRFQRIILILLLLPTLDCGFVCASCSVSIQLISGGLKRRVCHAQTLSLGSIGQHDYLGYGNLISRADYVSLKGSNVSWQFIWTFSRRWWDATGTLESPVDLKLQGRFSNSKVSPWV